MPVRIEDETQLDDLLSAPSATAIAALRALPGDIVVLGVAGKMGPTLARMARRAADAAGTPRRVIGVSRFSEAGQEASLREQRAKLSGQSNVSKAIAYCLTRWVALTRFLGDGRLCMSNNAAEREIRPVAMTESFCTPSSSIWKH